MLKKLMIGAAFAAMIAAPALAQSYDPSAGSGNIVSPNGGPVTAETPPYLGPGNAYAHVGPGGGFTAGSAYAYAPRRPHGQCRTYHCDPSQY